jgi:hypothetical protein
MLACFVALRHECIDLPCCAPPMHPLAAIARDVREIKGGAASRGV